MGLVEGPVQGKVYGDKLSNILKYTKRTKNLYRTCTPPPHTHEKDHKVDTTAQPQCGEGVYGKWKGQVQIYFSMGKKAPGGENGNGGGKRLKCSPTAVAEVQYQFEANWPQQYKTRPGYSYEHICTNIPTVLPRDLVESSLERYLSETSRQELGRYKLSLAPRDLGKRSLINRSCQRIKNCCTKVSDRGLARRFRDTTRSCTGVFHRGFTNKSGNGSCTSTSVDIKCSDIDIASV